MNSVAMGCCAVAALAIAGCASTPREPIVASLDAPAELDWRDVATSEDRSRIRSWREAFVKALDAARAGGHAVEISQEGALLVPDAALSDPRPPAGNYRCRVFKLGANGPAMRDFTTYPSFACRIENEGDVASFAKLSGSQRPVGIIFEGDSQRQIFLGTLMLGDEQRALDYGRDPTRDMAGAIERVGVDRWRLILPYPHFESIMDVIELVPAQG